MAGFDKTQRRETHIFQELFQEKGKPLFRRMQFNLVEYDGDPNQYIEPRPASDILDAVAVEPRVLKPVTDGVGVIADFQFYQKRPFDVHSFNDTVDV